MVPLNFLKKKKDGFTLIELLVAVAVLGVVSSFVFASVGKRQQDATRAAQKLALDIRTAQNRSLAPTDDPICVYGIHADDTSSYFLYKRPDCPLPRAVASNNQYDEVSSTKIETITLSGASITSAVPFDVSFEAPEPITFLNGATGTEPMTITVSGQGISKNIEINRFGRIDIQ